MYHQVEGTGTGTAGNSQYRVVRFIVQPFSIKHDFEPNTGDKDMDSDESSYLPKRAKIIHPIATCRMDSNTRSAKRENTNYYMVTAPTQQSQPTGGKVLFTYDVIWIENEGVEWASR
jgi:transmembrane 9 superfamily protein 2/4